MSNLALLRFNDKVFQIKNKSNARKAIRTQHPIFKRAIKVFLVIFATP